MLRYLRAVLSATLLLSVQALAQAADRPVHMQVPPDLAKDLAALPTIGDPANEAERRINAALKRLDATVRKAARECAADAKGGESSWERHIDVSMRGPRFLSYAIHDSLYCGGPHPDHGMMAIVYDLATGSPVDWTTLLPASLTGKVALKTGADGTKMVTLASKRLQALYLERYRPGTAKSDDADDKSCREAVAETDDIAPRAMMAWLDAKQGGLALGFDLAHAVQACADTVVIPASVLRKEGAQAVLVDAIEAAAQATQRK